MCSWCPPMSLSGKSKCCLGELGFMRGERRGEEREEERGGDSDLSSHCWTHLTIKSIGKRRHYDRLSPVIALILRGGSKLLVMVDGSGEEKKKSPGGKKNRRRRCCCCCCCRSVRPIRCVDVVKWLVRKCERDNDRLCMTPLGAPHLSCVWTPSAAHTHTQLLSLSQRL